jgi:hypothetical protein
MKRREVYGSVNGPPGQQTKPVFPSWLFLWASGAAAKSEYVPRFSRLQAHSSLFLTADRTARCPDLAVSHRCHPGPRSFDPHRRYGPACPRRDIGVGQPTHQGYLFVGLFRPVEPGA